MLLFCGMFWTTRTKMGMIRQSYYGIDGINFSETIYTEDKEKSNIVSIVRRCKKYHHVIFLSVNSAIESPEYHYRINFTNA